MIPFLGVDRQYKTIREEILDVTDIVYSSGQVLDGQYTKTFEQTIAEMTDAEVEAVVDAIKECTW